MNFHLKPILRRLLKNKTTSIINILGLAVGFGASVLLMMYVHYESTYDRSHVQSPNIYQVFVQWGSEEQYSLAPPLAQRLLETFPEIEQVARYIDWDSEWLVSANGKNVKVKHAMGADNALFELFTVDFILGSAPEALKRPGTAILNETTALKIFGNRNPLGESIVINRSDTMEITGVVKDLPKNNSINFNILYSVAGYPESWNEQWMNHTLSTFILVNDNASLTNLRSKMPQFTHDCLEPYFRETDGRSFDDFIKETGSYQFGFRQLTEVHLSGLVGDRQPLKSRLNLLLFIGLLIFVIACINYTNLSTIQVITRAKEIGIRKVTGSSIARLLFASYVETAIVVSMAIMAGCLFLWWALPYFNQLIESELSLQFSENPVLHYGIPASFLVAVLMAGTYPAVQLTLISPKAAFQKPVHQKTNFWSFRNLLTIGQFVVCIVMIAITILFSKQINFVTQQNLGFDPDQILIIKDAYLVKPEPFRESIMRIPEVEAATFTNTVPGRHYNNQGIHVKGTAPGSYFAHAFTGDYDLKETFNMELVAGRWFSEDLDKDKASCILNEAAVKSLNINEPLNEILDEGSWQYEDVDEVKIIGVIKDFNFQSLQYAIQPMAIYPKTGNDYLCLKVSTENLKNIIPQIKTLWDKQSGNLPFEYFFLDDDFNRNYASDTQLQSIVLWFSLLAIFVTCLGLLGVSSFLILRRTKEIGVRKVNGATSAQLIRMLNYDFIKWVVIAILIATPISVYLSNQWLENFAYKTSLSWWVFACAGVLAIGITLITISWYSWHAATRNPVDALRYE